MYSFINNLSDEVLERLALNEAKQVEVVTFDDSEPAKSNWYYKVYVEHPYKSGVLTLKEESGNTSLCSCSECQEFGAGRFERYSISLALAWIKENCNADKVTVHVSPTNGIHLDDYNGLDEWVRECRFLETLNRDVLGLAHELRANSVLQK